VTEKGSNWFQATTSTLGRCVRFEAGDILLDIHFEPCLGRRTVHSNTGDLNVWSHTWIYQERRKVVGINVPFGIVCFVTRRKQITLARGTQWNKLEENYQILVILVDDITHPLYVTNEGVIQIC
jgi:hypothetical protein